MPSLIDKRLAAAIEVKQHESLLRVEGIADKVESRIRRHARDAVRIAADFEDQRSQRQAADTLKGMIAAASGIMDQQFRRLHWWSYEQSMRVWARQIPRRWFRKALPAAVLVGEAEIGLPPSNAVAATDTEPVAGKRLSDAEWEAFLKEHLFPPPSREQVEAVIYAPLLGKDWRQRMDDLSHRITDFDRLAGTLVTGASQGMSQRELAQQIAPVVNNIASSARRIARTEGLRIATMTQRTQYAELGDMLAGVQIVATLDENTRPHHASRNGTVYWVDRRKKPTIDELPVLPDEPNCRCYDTPVLQTPEEFENDPQLRAEFENAAGDAIPDPQVYSQWFDQADVGRRKQAVGVRRYEAVAKRLGKTRQPQFADFIGDDGAILTLETLKRENDRERNARLLRVQKQMKLRQELLAKVSKFGFASSKDFVPLPPNRESQPEDSVTANIHPGTSASFSKEVSEILNSLPRKVHEILRKGGQRIDASEFLTDIRQDLRGKRPRGWPANATWDQVDGLHDRGQKQIVVAEKTRESSGEVRLSRRTAGSLRHEIGHAVDQSLRGFSQTKKFRDAYKKDALQLAGKMAGHLEYFLQPGEAGPSEVFAEACAIILGEGSVSPSTEKAFRAAFPETLSLVQERIS